MAGSPSEQQEIDFVDAEFVAHLERCGLTNLQARLASLVWKRGQPREQHKFQLQISSRSAATLLKCNDRSVRDAAATLARREWFTVCEQAPGRPPWYVLDELTARSLEEFDPLEVRATAGHCGPPRATAEPSPCSESNPITKPVSYSNSNSDHGHPAPPRTTPHHSAPLRTGDRRLPSMPWRRGEVTDADLVAAVRHADRELLRHLYDHAQRMQWLAHSPDNWLKFLTGCHHAATNPKIQRRMGVLVMFVKGGLNVTRYTQASDDWAARMLAREARDPALVALGRSMAPEEVF